MSKLINTLTKMFVWLSFDTGTATKMRFKNRMRSDKNTECWKLINTLIRCHMVNSYDTGTCIVFILH